MTTQNSAIFTCIKQLFETLSKNEQVDLMISLSQNKAIFICIKQLFEVLNKTEQVDLVISLYDSMNDAQKNNFLCETENA